jgi:hypothetical protein
MPVKPILFSAAMIRALLAGQKTQTRRLLKGAPTGAAWSCEKRGEQWNFIGLRGALAPFDPRFASGDHLWVREAWCHDQHAENAAVDGQGFGIRYRASNPEVEGIDDGDGYAVINANGTVKSPWRSPIHMPRSASRLTLKVTDVRVQRVGEISEDDAAAEGIDVWVAESLGQGCPPSRTATEVTYGSRAQAFAHLWDTIHGMDAFNANPWVAAVSFRAHHRNVDELLKHLEAA